MEIISAKPTKFVEDWSFRFVNGEAWTVTLDAAHDTLILGDRLINITCHDPLTGATTEVTEIERRNLLLHSFRKREVPVYAPGESPIDQLLAEIAAKNPVKEPKRV